MFANRHSDRTASLAPEWGTQAPPSWMPVRRSMHETRSYRRDNDQFDYSPVWSNCSTTTIVGAKKPMARLWLLPGMARRSRKCVRRSAGTHCELRRGNQGDTSHPNCSVAFRIHGRSASLLPRRSSPRTNSRFAEPRSSSACVCDVGVGRKTPMARESRSSAFVPIDDENQLARSRLALRRQCLSKRTATNSMPSPRLNLGSAMRSSWDARALGICSKCKV